MPAAPPPLTKHPAPSTTMAPLSSQATATNPQINCGTSTSTSHRLPCQYPRPMPCPRPTRPTASATPTPSSFLQSQRQCCEHSNKNTFMQFQASPPTSSKLTNRTRKPPLKATWTKSDKTRTAPNSPNKIHFYNFLRTFKTIFNPRPSQMAFARIIAMLQSGIHSLEKHSPT